MFLSKLHDLDVDEAVLIGLLTEGSVARGFHQLHLLGLAVASVGKELSVCLRIEVVEDRRSHEEVGLCRDSEVISLLECEEGKWRPLQCTGETAQVCQRRELNVTGA